MGMFCPTCGKELAQGVVYCPGCGEQVTKPPSLSIIACRRLWYSNRSGGTITIVLAALGIIDSFVPIWGFPHLVLSHYLPSRPQ